MMQRSPNYLLLDGEERSNKKENQERASWPDKQPVNVKSTEDIYDSLIGTILLQTNGQPCGL